ncbi:uncharacterized protein L969DRAFT_26055 [Mixia osmundae IAM 14324]|uniref:Double-strand break repair protein n=1 Tax=Mixia osmundae (strain CBS 9802 / IAM 14324 / JCM 22182 / KY 12970) TaxID=764103 RepID=G7DZG5_MIXOS|nr:uncharacterized protein L969DRAFT_26055 [Mixia osmundae IAM 14324]KEI37146.1 hypothetical protein L969DRAFT_26055 [Mixia osmundae IAM 14324]GAA95975.1 hypothetical protein E5Q_02633 [Mixia osmundae IAM 14324]
MSSEEPGPGLDGADERDALPAPSNTINGRSPRDCIKFLLATDNHVGAHERDPIRGMDSINSFREVVDLAVANRVDALLLAGDLFHENKPSRISLHQVMAILRERCFSRSEVNLEVISDLGLEGGAYSEAFPTVNYEDTNINVGLPVFSIHGNHDDPQGAGPEGGALSALDLLSVSGLINYFGRQELPGSTITDSQAKEQGIEIKPILLKKGKTKLCMYGVGNMRDERFHQELRAGRIRYMKPQDQAEEWFNLMLIHQNRAPRTQQSYVPENALDSDIDLVVWGHEHDSRIIPETVPGRRYFITQPGSTVSTSLIEAEAAPKTVALLSIQGKDFQIDPIVLRTVRPFKYKEISLAEVQENDEVELNSRAQITKFLKSQIQMLIAIASQEHQELNEDPNGSPVPPMLPLIRLKVDFRASSSVDEGTPDFDVPNSQRFGQEFAGKVANPKDIVQFYRSKKVAAKKSMRVVPDQPDQVGLEDVEPGARAEKVQVETFVRQYLEAQHMEILDQTHFGQAVESFIEKDDNKAISEFVGAMLKSQRKQLSANASYARDRTTEVDQIEALVEKTKAAAAASLQEFGSTAGKKKGKNAAVNDEGSDSFDSDFDRPSDGDFRKTPPAKGKTRAPAKSRAKSPALFRDEDDEDDDEEELELPSASRKPVAKGKRASPATTRKPAAKPRARKVAEPPPSAMPRARRTAATDARKRTQAEQDDDSSDIIELDD